MPTIMSDEQQTRRVPDHPGVRVPPPVLLIVVVLVGHGLQQAWALRLPNGSGWSGKYMVENSTREIFGIKGYGKVHKGHRYGTLETISKFYWGEYTPHRHST